MAGLQAPLLRLRLTPRVALRITRGRSTIFSVWCSEATLPFTLSGSLYYHLHDRDFLAAYRQVRSTQ
jgi:hypothetical protein